MEAAVPAAVPIWQKYLLTPDEAAALSGLSPSFIRHAGLRAKNDGYNFPCCWIGMHMKVNRILFEKWLIDKTDGHRDFKTEWLIKETDKPRRGRPRKVR